MTDVFSGVFSNTVNSIHNRQAAQALAGNDYAGAMSNLARIGNVQGVNNLRNQQRTEQTADAETQRAEAARSVAFVRQATNAIGKTMQEGGNPLETFDQIAPAMQSLGATPEQINGYRQQLAQNPTGFLQGVKSLLENEERKLEIVNFGSGLGAAAVDQATGNVVNRIDPTYRPVGDVLYDPSKREVVFDARKPEYQTIRNADGSTSVVAIDPSPLATSAPAGAVAPAAGNSVGERNNNQGNIRDVGQFAGNPAYLGKDERGFARFSNAEAGNQAQERQLNLYYTGRSRHTPNGPVQNIGGIIDIYAPVGPENSPESVANYKSYVARRLGIGVNDRVPEDKIPAMAQAMREFETGNTVGAGAAQPASATTQGGSRVVASGAPQTGGSEYTTLTAEEKREEGLPESGIYQRNNRTGQLTPVASPSAEKFTNDQRNAASFYHRVTQASTELDALRGRGVTTPSPQVLLGDGTINQALRSQTDRQFMQAARNWLAPILRKDTGAAVTDTELVYYMDIYIPKPGDGPEVLAQKSRARATAEQSLRAQAGNAYTEMFGNSPAAPQQQRRSRLSFQPSQQQLGWVRQNNPSANSPVGSQQNPRLINPQSPQQSYNNIQRGQYYVAPDGTLRRKN